MTMAATMPSVTHLAAMTESARNPPHGHETRGAEFLSESQVRDRDRHYARQDFTREREICVTCTWSTHASDAGSWP